MRCAEGLLKLGAGGRRGRLAWWFAKYCFGNKVAPLTSGVYHHSPCFSPYATPSLPFFFFLGGGYLALKMGHVFPRAGGCRVCPEGGGGWKLLEGSVWGAPGRGGLLWRDASGQGAPW